jgi:peptide-methionine (S)-S-oxide reductase
MMDPEMEVATLGGGCFWCLEAVFKEVRGVEKVVSGYSGGNVPDPSYQAVCAGMTGHAEVVQVTFDAQLIDYREILEIFFAIHDPTTLNRQGGDVGTQYRSAIFYHDANQKTIAEEMIAALDASGTWSNPIVTEVVPLDVFYAAEDYHRDYYERNPRQPYCRVVVAPKVAKLHQNFVAKLK